MVLDEFHESESWNSRVRDVMKALAATCRWGLSGTPPLDSTDSVLEVAEILRYATGATPFMTEALKNRKKEKSEKAQSWLADEGNKQKVHDSYRNISHFSSFWMFFDVFCIFLPSKSS